MPATVRFEVPREVDGKELAEFLRGHRFAVDLARHEDRFELDICYADAERARLSTDVWEAVENWLAERESVLVPARLAEQEYVLAPPAA